LDTTTREWTDGLFTHILRKIIDNARGESERRHWIVFDGDVDPEWVENLNALLDDNKLLTLPNGERLALPDNGECKNISIRFIENRQIPNTVASLLLCFIDFKYLFSLSLFIVRIIFEVQDLKYATLATVSRCGMIWFNEETVTNQMIFQNYLLKLKNVPFDEQERQTYNETLPPPSGLIIQRQMYIFCCIPIEKYDICVSLIVQSLMLYIYNCVVQK
jgi:dynein heavy chain 1